MRISDWSSDVCSSDLARGKEEVFKARDEMKAAGGKVIAYTADLSDMADCYRLVKKVLDEHGHVDVLINNAGRSIRRSIEASYDRFHDFERTMQLNYFGSIRLIMGFMPAMTHRRRGHIINISRSEERRVGKECVSPCRSRGSP